MVNWQSCFPFPLMPLPSKSKDIFLVDIEGTEDEILDDPYKYAEIVRTAREQIIEHGIADYLNGDNIDEIKEDTECPYMEEEEEE